MFWAPMLTDQGLTKIVHKKKQTLGQMSATITEDLNDH